MRNQSAKNVLMKDGSVRRQPAPECEVMLAKGQAKRYISNTLYRAVRLGIEVKNFDDRDEKGALKGRIRAATDKANAATAKAEAKKKVKQGEESNEE